ncbi:MAG: AbrB/MazE/SpoVT family DNA-binding domain-containing protein [Lentisphaerae bacterium]|nr:AbrB/MazE/SpoVT family DNA-binding domain-containing protein [Lentisphaerota bacterium]
MRITSKGQVTIPQDIRETMGFWPHTEVEFVLEDGRVHVRKPSDSDSRGSRLVQRLRGKGRVGMTTDQILALTRSDAP